jgi:hypothetical protein
MRVSDITGSRVVDYFFFPAPAASAARFSSAVRGGNRLACLDILARIDGRRTGSHGHTLPLLLAHDRGSILLGLLELGTGQGVLGFLVGRRKKGQPGCLHSGCVADSQYRSMWV